MRTLWAVLVWLPLAAVAGIAQDKSAYPFVDLGKAQALIDVMTKENETLQTEALRLRQEASDLTAQVVAAQKGVADLVPLWNAVKARYGELATLDADLVDPGLRTRSAAEAAKILPLLKRLSQKVDDQRVRAVRLGTDVQARLDQASVDEARMVRNTDDIILLQAAVARTRAQAGRLDAVISQLNALSAQAEAALQ